MTVAQFVTQLQQLLLEHPQTADHTVRLMPHGIRPRQDVEQIRCEHLTVLLEAQR